MTTCLHCGKEIVLNAIGLWVDSSNSVFPQYCGGHIPSEVKHEPTKTVKLFKEDKDVFQMIRDKLDGLITDGTISVSQDQAHNVFSVKCQWNEKRRNGTKEMLWFSVKFDVLDFLDTSLNPAEIVAEHFVGRLIEWREEWKEKND